MTVVRAGLEHGCLSNDPAPQMQQRTVIAVLFDRDGTLIHNVPYNADPQLVVPMPGARQALDRLRSAQIPTAVITNQSAISRGLATPRQVEIVNRRVELLLGPVGPWFICPHQPTDDCRCRKPAPDLVFRAAMALSVAPRDCIVIGDADADVEAARAAGARAILVSNDGAHPGDSARAGSGLTAAVDRVLAGEWR